MGKAEGKFKVIPNLSIKGIEVLKRLNNRSLIPNGNTGEYTLDEKIADSLKMNKRDLLMAVREEQFNAVEGKKYLSILEAKQTNYDREQEYKRRLEEERKKWQEDADKVGD